MRANVTQAALERAAELRAYGAALAAIEWREAVPPIGRRRVARLADMVRARPAFDNRHGCGA